MLRNDGVRFLRVRWGKVVGNRLYLDTQLVAEVVGQACPMPRLGCSGCAGVGHGRSELTRETTQPDQGRQAASG